MNRFDLNNINNDFKSYQQLIDFFNQNKDNSFNTIHLSLHTWFAANLSSALGAILDKLILNLNSIRLEKIPDGTKKILRKNNFLPYYGYPILEDTNNTTIKYLKLKPTDGRFFHGYIFNELLNRSELPNMSQGLKNKITEAIYEVFNNATIHSETEFIYTCGQFFPGKQKIEFTITDTGIGFKKCINERFGKNLTSVQAIKWATIDGNTTKQGITGGIGLAILKEFIILNKGMIQIISDDGFYKLDTNGEDTHMFSGSFPGTVVNLEFNTEDTSSYTLSGEFNYDDIF